MGEKKSRIPITEDVLGYCNGTSAFMDKWMVVIDLSHCIGLLCPERSSNCSYTPFVDRYKIVEILKIGDFLNDSKEPVKIRETDGTSRFIEPFLVRIENVCL